MTRDEQIRKLTDDLIKLMATPEVTESETVMYDKTINDLKNGLNVDVSIVKQIMRRVDEVYGRKEANIYSAPLYEEFGKLLKD